MAKFTLLLFLLLFLFRSGFTTNPDVKFEYLTTVDGLPSNYINVIFQDSFGFMWFGTRNGLVRYDGYKFKIYQPENSPSSISGRVITSIHEDKNGNLWIGTDHNGLNKFDRNKGRFIHFKHDPLDSTGLRSNEIWTSYLDSAGYLWVVYADLTLGILNTESGRVSPVQYGFDHSGIGRNMQVRRFFSSRTKQAAIYEDSRGDVWIGASHGLNRYHHQSNTFTCYQHDPYNQASISSDSILTIFEDSKNSIWICTQGGGINKYSRETDSFTRFRHNADDPQSLGSDYSDFVYEDASQRMWVFYKSGLDYFNRDQGEFIRLQVKPSNFPDSKNSGYWWRGTPLFEDEMGFLWLLGDNSWKREIFLARFLPESAAFYDYYYDANKPGSFRAYALVSHFKDHSGILWFGTEWRGLNKFDPLSQQFTLIQKDPTDIHSLADNQISSICRSTSNPNILWIGTRESLEKYDMQSGRAKHFRHDPNNKNSVVTGSLLTLYEDESGLLWIGSYFGFASYDDKAGVFTHYRHDPENKKSIGSNYVHIICPDPPAAMWLGSEQMGVNHFNAKTGVFTRFKHDPQNPKSLSAGLIYSILIDHDHNLWVATYTGLNKFNPQDSTFERYLEGTPIAKIYQDHNHHLWLGTWYDGLAHFDPHTGQAVFYNKTHGLVNNKINSITEDKEGQLWLGMEGGLSKFDPVTKSISSYHREYELQGMWFDPSGLVLEDGRLLLATAFSGILLFDPREIKINKVPPRVVLTNISLFDKPLAVDSDSPLKEDITVAKEIELASWQNDISLEMTALHYRHPLRNTYSYMLENYDADWRYSGTNRIATYTNLDPGTYKFSVKAANSDGVWSEEKTLLRLVIRAPWWGTWWARAMYLLLFFALGLIIWNTQLKRIRWRHQVEMQQFEAQKLIEVDAMKSRFFANISHEFRTPITLILGPIEKMLSRHQDMESQHDLNIMQRNARRLLRLINQLLDLSKLEAGRMKLQARLENIVDLVNRFVQSFESQASLKRIDLQFSAEEKSLLIYVDREKIENIIYNLVANALKFTPEGGTVLVNVKERDQEYVQITVSDSGAGIPQDRLDRVFDRFYQVDDSKIHQHEGTGIGLALTKELVEMHKGKISVVSSDLGSTFTVLLPLGKEHLSANEIAAGDIVATAQPEVDLISAESNIFEEVSPQSTAKAGKSAPRLLIVEDNSDLRAFMREVLQPAYHIKEAADGRQGCDLALKIIPDLIISDVMMPGCDGFELCRILKTDERTSHIPIILLTARASIESKVEGFETGADDYIIKPFDERELKARAANLIDSRRKLRRRFRNAPADSETCITSLDERFLQRAQEIVNDYMADSDFTVDVFANKVGFGKTQLYRKLKALTDLPPHLYIRFIRLQHAARLLENHVDNITQVSYEVGFNSPAHFAKAFRQQFGMSPSDFVRQADGGSKLS